MSIVLSTLIEHHPTFGDLSSPKGDQHIATPAANHSDRPQLIIGTNRKVHFWGIPEILSTIFSAWWFFATPLNNDGII
jgi:hypothetical protein